MNRFSKFILPMLAFCLPLFSTCKHQPMPEPACKLPDVVSFSRDIIPVFTANCITAGCHSGSPPAGNLNLEAANAYSQLWQPGSGYIDTVTPRYSLLYAQLNSTSTPMPPTGKLDTCTKQLILKWIEQKAPNN